MDKKFSTHLMRAIMSSRLCQFLLRLNEIKMMGLYGIETEMLSGVN